MTELTRREFLLVGAAGGAVIAVGVILPLTRNLGSTQVIGPDGSITTTTLGQPSPTAVVGLFPKVQIATLGDLTPDHPVRFEYPLQGQHSILVKLGQEDANGVGPDRDIVAYSSLCTHMGCNVETYQPEHRALGPCPCHFSVFDLAANGQVSLGQASQSLPQILLSIEDNAVYAVGVLRLVYGHANTLEGAPLVEA